MGVSRWGKIARKNHGRNEKVMTKNAQVTVPLGIPDVRVLNQESDAQGELIITIEGTQNGGACHPCGHWAKKFQGHDSWVKVRHLPVFGHPTYLRYRPRRFSCENCEGHPTTTEHLDWVNSNSPHTLAYDQPVLLELVNARVEEVSVKELLSYPSVVGVLDRCIQSSVDWSAYTQLDVLGLDEIALRKGHRDFVVSVTARQSAGRVA
jgi:transposase